MPLPVIFLPGVMGSRLRWRDGSARTWDPDSNLAMLSWIKLGIVGGERLAKAMHHLLPVEVMHYAGAGLTEQQVERGWGGISRTYYHTALHALEQAGHQVYAIGYDWRQDMIRLADE